MGRLYYFVSQWSRPLANIIVIHHNSNLPSYLFNVAKSYDNFFKQVFSDKVIAESTQTVKIPRIATPGERDICSERHHVTPYETNEYENFLVQRCHSNIYWRSNLNISAFSTGCVLQLQKKRKKEQILNHQRGWNNRLA